MAYRYWCGECGFRTRWLSEFQGAHQQIEHYAEHHPGVPAGGDVEVSRRNPNRGGGCLPLIVAALLVLVLAAACHH